MTVIEVNGEPVPVEPPVKIPAGGMILWTPDARAFGIYDAGGSLLLAYTRVADVFLGTLREQP
jgi:hypothetical protein